MVVTTRALRAYVSQADRMINREPGRGDRADRLRSARGNSRTAVKIGAKCDLQQVPADFLPSTRGVAKLMALLYVRGLSD